MSQTDQQTDNQWFKNPWVWFVMFVPFSAVLFGIVMITSANYQRDDLVVDDYYKEGKGINRRIRQDVQAATTGATATVMAITPQGVVFDIYGGGELLTLEMFHVTSQSQDLQVDLVRQSETQYTAASPLLAERLQTDGVWYLEVRDEDSGWRLRQRIETPIGDLKLEAKP